jgi:RimJ/RimL family protein N-acetyltransferase
MLHKLRPAEFGRIRPLYAGWRFDLRVNSLLNSYSRGQVYVDRVVNPQTAVAWIDDMFYLVGEESNEAFRRSWPRWLNEVILPKATMEGLGYFAVQVYPLEPWREPVQALLKGREVQVNHEHKFAFRPKTYRQIVEWPDLPDGLALQRVDRQLLQDASCQGLLQAVQRRNASIDAFLTRGLGVVLRQGKSLISACVSAYVDRGLHELAVDTYDPQQRGHGFATLTSRACIDQCLAQGLTPVWTADESNAASLALARKLGFEQVGSYPDWNFAFS